MAANGIPTLQDFGQLLPEMTMIMKLLATTVVTAFMATPGAAPALP